MAAELALARSGGDDVLYGTCLRADATASSSSLSIGGSGVMRPRSGTMVRAPQSIQWERGKVGHTGGALGKVRGMTRLDGGKGRRYQPLHLMSCKECSWLRGRFGTPPAWRPPFLTTATPASRPHSSSPAAAAQQDSLAMPGEWRNTRHGATPSQRTWSHRYSAQWDLHPFGASLGAPTGRRGGARLQHGRQSSHGHPARPRVGGSMARGTGRRLRFTQLDGGLGRRARDRTDSG